MEILSHENNSQNDMLKKLPSIPYTMIDTDEDLLALCENIINNDIKLIGIDTEYHRGDKYEGSLCLCQLSYDLNGINSVYILDLLSLDAKKFSLNMSRILSNNKIEKILHCYDNDVEWIYENYKIIMTNIFDTQEAFKRVSNKKKGLGLDELLNNYFGLNIDKEVKKYFQTSNWIIRPLTSEQLNYAALDSSYLIRLRNIIVQELNKNKFNLDRFKDDLQERINNRLQGQTKQERKEAKAINYLLANIVKCDELENTKDIILNLVRFNDQEAKRRDFNPDNLLNIKTIYRICTRLPDSEPALREIIEVNKTLKDIKDYPEFVSNLMKIINTGASSMIVKENPESKTNQRKMLKEVRKQAIVKKFLCKKPVYENCRMLAPDGDPLCFCDRKKMNWYLERGFAEIVTTDPPVFKLLFEPNKKGCLDSGNIKSDFYIKDRKNCCVVCGKESEYMRFHVVPALYRQYFVDELKSHKSHDVLLLCFPCHEKANKLYDIEKRRIGDEYKVPINSLSMDQIKTKNLEQAIRNAKTLYKNLDLMPAKNRDHLGGILIAFLQENKDDKDLVDFYDIIFTKNNIDLPTIVSDLNKQTLEKIKNYKPKIYTNGERKNFHGKLIVDMVGDLEDFIRHWRSFFMQSLNPQYLPEEWNVNHEFHRTFGVQSVFYKNQLKSDK